MSSVHYAVIAGEIAESKKMPQEKLGRIPDIIRACFKEVNEHLPEEDDLTFEIIRMDEFLCLTKRTDTALKSGYTHIDCQSEE